MGLLEHFIVLFASILKLNFDYFETFSKELKEVL